MIIGREKHKGWAIFKGKKCCSRFTTALKMDAWTTFYIGRAHYGSLTNVKKIFGKRGYKAIRCEYSRIERIAPLEN